MYYVNEVFQVLLTMTEVAEDFQYDPQRGEKVD